MRGEYSMQIESDRSVQGSPPHARGIHICDFSHSLPLGITPACAGNTPCGLLLNVHHWDHPRMRGEYEIQSFAHSFVKGSPPHARGILQKNMERVDADGITPACAGNTFLNPRFSH